MRTQEILVKKRDGHELTPEEIQHWIQGYMKGEIKDYHVASWLMAVFFRGMTAKETAALTECMLHSGSQFPREKSKDEIWIDKHSTGGVGDKTSLLLVPWVASTWTTMGYDKALLIPMVSGRGLGFTGGTLDKLEAVPGFKTRIPLEKSQELLNTNGFVMMGQTDEMAPADKLLYALRDVTGTVECLPLIVSSILSKKIAENVDALVLDVKFGAGAMMKTVEGAAQLARMLIDVAALHQVKAVAVLTSMEEPLGKSVGHLLEMRECLEFFRGKNIEPGLLEVTRKLALEKLTLATGGKVSSSELSKALDDELASGRPLAIFRQMLEAQGGDWNKFISECDKLDNSMNVVELRATSDGFIREINPLVTAHVVGRLGGSRATKEDVIDPDVGVEFLKKVGDRVKSGDVIARIFCRTQEQSTAALKDLSAGIHLSTGPSKKTRWIEKVMQ